LFVKLLLERCKVLLIILKPSTTIGFKKGEAVARPQEKMK